MQDKQEPRLAVRPRPVAWFLRPRFLRMFVPVASLAVVGFVALCKFASPLLPFERVVTLEGGMASKAEFFDDRRVQELLIQHRIRVHVTRQGSRELATELRLFDFVFPSGQPSADLIKELLRQDGRRYGENGPFTSPIVLATYRDYAEALVAEKDGKGVGVATPLVPKSGQPYVYTLNMEKFLELLRSQTSWNHLANSKLTSKNGVLAQHGSVCKDNSAATYLGLVSYVFMHGERPRGALPHNDKEADEFAGNIKGLLTAQGMTLDDPWGTYLASSGLNSAAIFVVYEHQYLAYQLKHLKQSSKLDSDRVLLYPDRVFETKPQFIMINEKDVGPLSDLLKNDQDLRGRAVELGFQVNDGSGQNLLSELLNDRAPELLPVNITTRAMLPETRLLEKMLKIVDDCQPVLK